MQPKITVAICTFNRAQLLPRAIDSLLAQTLPPSEFEILIVDNGSSDNTREVAGDYQRRLSNLRYVCEPALGVAKARNRAIREAAGSYLVFLDDDAAACPQWLEFHRQAWQAGYRAVAGPVELDWPDRKPAWLLPEHESLFAHYTFGAEDLDLPPHAYFLTTNASFEVSLLKSFQGFNENLGHRGRLLVGGEDNEFFKRLTAAGIRIRYASRAKVLHVVEKQRITRGWLIKRMFWDGFGMAAFDFKDRNPGIKRIFYDAKQAMLHFFRMFFSGARESRWREARGFLQHSGRAWGELTLINRKK